MKNTTILMLLLLTLTMKHLVGQEKSINYGCFVNKTISSVVNGSKLGLSANISHHFADVGLILTGLNENDYPKGINGFVIDYKVYPRQQKIFNQYFYLDNKCIISKIRSVPETNTIGMPYIRNLPNATEIEISIGYGIDLTILQQFKVYTDIGVGYFNGWYKRVGDPDFPKSIGFYSVQIEFGMALYLKKFSP